MKSTDHHLQIILDLAQVPDWIKKFRASGQKIVLTQGSFDMIHVGHARYLAKAKSFGDVLIVGLDSDEKVKVRKGEDRPVVPQDERLEMLTYLESVDLVVLKPMVAPKYQLIKLVKPDVLVATKQTYLSQALHDLKQWCGRVEVLQPMATTSTSAKIRRLQLAMTHKLNALLTQKLMATIDDVFAELRGERK